MIKPLPLLVGFASLGACATVPPHEEPERRMPAGECVVDPTKPYIGRKATAELGAELLRVTGARVMRWVPPRTAITMDYSPNRLTVSYDDDYIIKTINCG